MCEDRSEQGTKEEQVAALIADKSKEYFKPKIDDADFQYFWQDVANILEEEYAK